MSKLCPLFSGSSGNSTYISNQGEGILVDVGRSANQIEKCLIDNDINVKSIKAIFITHEHADHVNGLKVFASRYKIKVYASKGTIISLEKKGIINGKFPYEAIKEEGIDINNIKIKPFRVSHDCAEGVGYTLEFPDRTKAAVCTDLGFISEEVERAILGCKVLVIESNHDVNMLKSGVYPYYLKRRILSEKGHLSNGACSAILPKLVKKGLCRIVLSHLSSKNNTSELAFMSAKKALEKENMKIGQDFTLNVASEVNSKIFNVVF